MKRLFALFLFVACTAIAAPSPFKLTVDSQSTEVRALGGYKAVQREFLVSFVSGTNVDALAAGDKPFMFWATNDYASSYVTARWSVVSLSSGLVLYTFTSTDMNTNGSFRYGVGVKDTNGIDKVVRQGAFVIQPSPYGSGVASPAFSSNQNLTGMTFSGAPWIENITLTTGGSDYVVSGAGTTRNLNVPTASSGSGSGTLTNLISSNAIITVAGGAGPQSTLNIVTSALVAALTGSFATGSPVYSLSGYATGTPVYAEADAQAIAQVGAASNALRVSIGLNATNIGTANTTATNLQGQITTNLTAQGLIGSNLLVVATLVTNVDGRVTTNLTAQGLIQSNLLFIATYTTNIDGKVTTNLTRLGALETNHVGQGVSLTNAIGSIATNLTAQGLLATNATQLGVIVTNLSGRVTTNYSALGLLDTNHIATGLAITNLQGLVSSNHLADGATQTNIQGQITTNLVAAGLIRTNLVQVGLVVTNLSGLVTTNFTAQGLIQSNLAVVAAQVTNNLVAQGAIDTNLTALTTNAVSKTWTNGQEMAGALHSRDRLSALTNLIVAATNAVGSEVLNNGTFTGSEAGWSLTNASYNANNILVLPSAAASITYTQAVIAARKVYQLSFVNTLAYGSNFTLFAVSIGGYTNVFPYAPTGTHTMTVGTRTDQPLVIRATPGTNQLVIDNVSIKEDVIGDIWAARFGIFGRDVDVGGNMTVASNFTAGTISGNATGYLPLVGGTLIGSVTGVFLQASNVSIAAGSSSIATNEITGRGSLSAIYRAGANTRYVDSGDALVAQMYFHTLSSLTNYGNANAVQAALVSESSVQFIDADGSTVRGYLEDAFVLLSNNANGVLLSGYIKDESLIDVSGGAGATYMFYGPGSITSRISGAGSFSHGGNIVNSGTRTFASGNNIFATNDDAFIWGDGAAYGTHGGGTFNVLASNGVWVSESRVFNAAGLHTGDGSQLTNLTAANLAVGGTFGALNAINLTNLPSAATTAGVNNISHTGAVSGNLTFTDGTGVDVSQTNATFYWSVIPGAVSGIDGRTLTNAVPLNLGTGAVALASLGNVPQTGQVNLININGTNYAGNLGFSGAGLSVSGTQLVFNGGSGVTVTNTPQAAAIKVLASSDGGTNYYLKDDATGGGGAIGMGPTNVVAGSFTQIYYTAGFKFMSTGEIAWLENVATGGGATNNFKARGITNSFEGFHVQYIDSAQTNASRGANGVVTNVVLMSATNVIRDTGTNYFSTPFVNTTSTYFTFRCPKGWNEITAHHYGNGITLGTAGQYEKIGLEVNKHGSRAVGTNSFGIYQASGGIFGWNQITTMDGGGTGLSALPGHLKWYNPSDTNIYTVLYLQSSGAFDGENCYELRFTLEFLGDDQ